MSTIKFKVKGNGKKTAGKPSKTNQSFLPPGPTTLTSPPSVANPGSSGGTGTKRKSGSSLPAPFGPFTQAGPSNAGAQSLPKRIRLTNSAVAGINQPPPPPPPPPFQWPPNGLKFAKTRDKKARKARALTVAEKDLGWAQRKCLDRVTGEIMAKALQRFLVVVCGDPRAGLDTSLSLHQLRLWEKAYPGCMFPLEPQAVIAIYGSTNARLGVAHVRLADIIDNLEWYLSVCLLLLSPTMTNQPIEAAQVRAIIAELGLNVVLSPTPANPSLAAQIQVPQWPPAGLQFLSMGNPGAVVLRPLSPEDEEFGWLLRSCVDDVTGRILAEALEKYQRQVCGHTSVGLDTSESLRQIRIWLTEYPTLLFPQEPQKVVATDLSTNARNDGGHNSLANIIDHTERQLSGCLLLLGPTMIDDAAAAAEVKTLIEDLGFRVLTQL